MANRRVALLSQVGLEPDSFCLTCWHHAKKLLGHATELDHKLFELEQDVRDLEEDTEPGSTLSNELLNLAEKLAALQLDGDNE